jgi:dTDP-4-dehydrorhamnose 3,5-epimerase-like enzyme
MVFEPARLISFSKIGESGIGFISVGENMANIPFEIKRVFWTYYTPDSILRGRHAHHNTEMVLVAVSGRIIVNTETPDGKIDSFILEDPNKGLFLPKYCWHAIQYSHSSVQLVMASTIFDESDYIRSYDAFKTICNS